MPTPIRRITAGAIWPAGPADAADAQDRRGPRSSHLAPPAAGFPRVSDGGSHAQVPHGAERLERPRATSHHRPPGRAVDRAQLESRAGERDRPQRHRRRRALHERSAELKPSSTLTWRVAAISIPASQKGRWAAENGAAFSTLRTLSSTQVSYYTQHGRFGRLPEVNAALGNSVGTVVDTTLIRGTYVFAMPDAETDAELKTRYRITARRDVSGDALYLYEVNNSGQIRQVFPVGAPN